MRDDPKRTELQVRNDTVANYASLIAREEEDKDQWAFKSKESLLHKLKTAESIKVALTNLLNAHQIPGESFDDYIKQEVFIDSLYGKNRDNMRKLSFYCEAKQN